MTTIKNWNDEPIEIGVSRNGTLAVANPYDNLLKTGISPWPPPEILQKLYKSNHEKAFEGSDLKAVRGDKEFYSDIQSLHSEDAMTWSIFGLLAYSDTKTRSAFTESLLELIEVPCSTVGNTIIWLWRRIPHPDTLVSGGPEIDFGIQTNDHVLIGEAKWLSKVARAQGKSRDKDQLTLRREFIRKFAYTIFNPVKYYIILSVSLKGGILLKAEEQLSNSTLYSRDITWDTLCGIQAHPQLAELSRYLVWKKINSKIG